jgi:CRISPR system Cascade subunit CasE
MRQETTTRAADAPPVLTYLCLRRDPSAGALAPLLGSSARAGGDPDAPRRGHHLIWSLFADRADRRRDFLWAATGPDTFVTLSARHPHDRHNLFHIERSQLFAPDVTAGDRVAFHLHANPVVSRLRQRQPRRMSKHDIITNVLRRHPEAERRRLLDETVRTRGVEWLAAQGRTGGFSVEARDVRIHGYRRHEVGRRPVRGRRRARSDNPRYATLEFDGTLTVTDPGQFGRAVAAGFGSSRTWGCGLMLIDTAPAAARTAA